REEAAYIGKRRRRLGLAEQALAYRGELSVLDRRAIDDPGVELDDVFGARALGAQDRHDVLERRLKLRGDPPRNRAIRAHADLSGEHDQPQARWNHGDMRVASQRRGDARRIEDVRLPRVFHLGSLERDESGPRPGVQKFTSKRA